MIRLSLLEMEKLDAILLSGEEDLNQKILRLLSIISDGLSQPTGVLPQPTIVSQHTLYMVEFFAPRRK